MSPPNARTCLADGVTLALAVLVVACAAALPYPRDTALPRLATYGGAALLGLLGRFADERGRARLARSVSGLAFAGIAAIAAHDLARDDVAALRPAQAAALLAFDLALPLLASWVLDGGPRRVPFALGVAMATVHAWPMSAFAPIAALSFMTARHALPSDPEPARQRISSLGAGACAGLAAAGLGFDVLARTVSTHAIGAHIDSAAHAAQRMALEALVLLGALDLARGRTRGVLLLAPSALALAAVIAERDLPHWGGCMIVAHPLFDVAPASLRHFVWLTLEQPVVSLALPLAVLPWLVPILRALRPPR
jgi:hypothetical protein